MTTHSTPMGWVKYPCATFALVVLVAAFRGHETEANQLELEKVKLQVEGLKYVTQIKQAELQLQPRYPSTTWYHTNTDLLLRGTTNITYGWIH